MFQRSLLTALFLAPLAVGQTTYEFITPNGAEFFEGNSSSNIMLGNLGASTRVQQVDNNLLGTIAPVINFIGWRRNNAATGSSGGPKMTDLQVIMSHADYANVTATFATNYKDPPVVVFMRRTVSLPDWNPAATLATFDARLPLDVPFVYNGVDALLWEVKKDNDPGSSYSQDWISVMPSVAYGALPEPLGVGCTTANGEMRHRVALRTDGSMLEFGFRVEGAPSAANVGLVLGFMDANIAVPGLCTTLRPLEVVSIPLGTADAAGDIALFFPISAPWTANSADVPLITQAWAMDAGQPGYPLSLSGGLLTKTPASTTPTPVNVQRIYSTTSSTAASGSLATSAAPTLYGL